MCKVQDVVKWNRWRQREWGNHAIGMKNNKQVKQARNDILESRQPIGRDE